MYHEYTSSIQKDWHHNSMTFSFDLISDLHVETWNDFDWTGQATSPYCVIAGDIAQDLAQVKKILQHLSNCYQGIFYIDGNDEHRSQLNNLTQSYLDIETVLSDIPNAIYLQNNVVIINGVALLATNGWWTYDLDLTVSSDETKSWVQDRYDVSQQCVQDICTHAYQDAAYLVKSVGKLQTYAEVKSIVLITHTVPGAWLINHDIDLVGEYRFNTMGNSLMNLVLAQDTEHKIHTWCFGHYHKTVDRDRNGVRYVNNCRGRGNTNWCQQAYYPKKIIVEC